MNRVIAWSAQNSVAANLLMLFFVVSGLLAARTVKQEVFPEFSLDLISIQIPYLGAAPEEVERAVNARVEDAIQGIDGIKQITSTASEGLGSVTVELELGADARKVVDDIKSNVDAIDTFPEQTEQPIIRELTSRQQVIDVAISGETDEFALKALAERVRDELSAVPQITQVEVVGARPYEISIEVAENTLRRHGLTFAAVADAVRRSSVDLPGGSVRSDGGEILLRTVGEASRGEEFADLVLLTRADGSRLILSDVATVVDGFAETDQFARFDGKPTVMVSVFRTGDQSALEIAELVNDYVVRTQTELPEGISLTVWQDQAKVLNDRLTLLLRNGLTGFGLVFLVLALFLELRLAFWVSIGIPISFLGAIMLMPGLDVSVNRKRRVHDDLEAAVREAGASRFRPILLTSLTTFVGLAPLMLERSFQAAFLIPMAVSLAFGVVFATFITLVLVPTAYLILEDVKRVLGKLVGRSLVESAP